MTILRNLEEKYKLKPVEIAKFIGISKSYYSMLKIGDRPISKSVAIQLMQQFGIKLEDSLCPSVHSEETGTRRNYLPKTG